MNASVIIGTGSYLPKKIVTNNDLAQKVETNDEWIQSRTGIKERHIAAPEELTSDMATNAALRAIDAAGIQKSEIDAIIVATTTPDRTFPSTAVTVQAKLEINNNCAAFDIQAVCSGFIYALSIANSFIKSGQYRNILIIGAEKMSSIVDWNDRRTCILFGDGAGAIVLQGQQDTDRGILDINLHADGNHQEILLTNSGVALNQQSGTIEMQGQEVFKHAVTKMASSIQESLDNLQLELSDIDYLVPHQANQRIIERIAKKMHLPLERVIQTVSTHANTSAASIPLALDSAAKENTFTQGSLLALTAIGGGLAWGSCILKW